MKDYRNKVVVVTGASSGIGAAICDHFIDLNALVIGVSRSKGNNNNVVFYKCDVAKLEDIEATVSDILSQFQKIDILVNCAGISFVDNAEELSPEHWQSIIDVNLTGAFFMCQAVGRAMIGNKAGKIINVASQAAVVGIDKHVAYCASKFAMVGMTKVMAIEWAQYNINVNCVSPTVVLTDLGKKVWGGKKGMDMQQQIPAKRFAQPCEIADAVVFLASDKSLMIHGENIIIDGGYTAQ